MTYLADPGGRFASDTHRRVLGHLSLPTDDYGWTAPALLERMRPDVGTNIETVEEMQSALDDLEADGHAEKLGDPSNPVWRMSQAGFDVITGPIANEPQPGEGVRSAAAIGAATQIGTNGSDPGLSGSEAAPGAST